VVGIKAKENKIKKINKNGLWKTLSANKKVLFMSGVREIVGSRGNQTCESCSNESLQELSRSFL